MSTIARVTTLRLSLPCSLLVTAPDPHVPFQVAPHLTRCGFSYGQCLHTGGVRLSDSVNRLYRHPLSRHLHTVLLLAALSMEVVGHACKILLTMDPRNRAYATVCLLGTHWGAILVNSAVYTVLPHEIVLNGHELCTAGDPVYLITCCVIDIFALSFSLSVSALPRTSERILTYVLPFPF